MASFHILDSELISAFLYVNMIVVGPKPHPSIFDDD